MQEDQETFTLKKHDLSSVSIDLTRDVETSTLSFTRIKVTYNDYNNYAITTSVKVKNALKKLLK